MADFKVGDMFKTSADEASPLPTGTEVTIEEISENPAVHSRYRVRTKAGTTADLCTCVLRENGRIIPHTYKVGDKVRIRKDCIGTTKQEMIGEVVALEGPDQIRLVFPGDNDRYRYGSNEVEPVSIEKEKPADPKPSTPLFLVGDAVRVVSSSSTFPSGCRGKVGVIKKVVSDGYHIKFEHHPDELWFNFREVEALVFGEAKPKDLSKDQKERNQDMANKINDLDKMAEEMKAKQKKRAEQEAAFPLGSIVKIKGSGRVGRITRVLGPMARACNPGDVQVTFSNTETWSFYYSNLEKAPPGGLALLDLLAKEAFTPVNEGTPYKFKVGDEVTVVCRSAWKEEYGKVLHAFSGGPGRLLYRVALPRTEEGYVIFSEDELALYTPPTQKTSSFKVGDKVEVTAPQFTCGELSPPLVIESISECWGATGKLTYNVRGEKYLCGTFPLYEGEFKKYEEPKSQPAICVQVHRVPGYTTALYLPAGSTIEAMANYAGLEARYKYFSKDSVTVSKKDALKDGDIVLCLEEPSIGTKNEEPKEVIRPALLKVGDTVVAKNQNMKSLLKMYKLQESEFMEVVEVEEQAGDGSGYFYRVAVPGHVSFNNIRTCDSEVEKVMANTPTNHNIEVKVLNGRINEKYILKSGSTIGDLRKLMSLRPGQMITCAGDTPYACDVLVHGRNYTLTSAENPANSSASPTMREMLSAIKPISVTLKRANGRTETFYFNPGSNVLDLFQTAKIGPGMDLANLTLGKKLMKIDASQKLGHGFTYQEIPQSPSAGLVFPAFKPVDVKDVTDKEYESLKAETSKKLKNILETMKLENENKKEVVMEIKKDESKKNEAPQKEKAFALRTVVAEVGENTPAQKAGLYKDDHVLQVNDIDVESLSHLKQLINEASGPTRLLISRKGKRKEVAFITTYNPEAQMWQSGARFSFSAVEDDSAKFCEDCKEKVGTKVGAGQFAGRNLCTGCLKTLYASSVKKTNEEEAIKYRVLHPIRFHTKRIAKWGSMAAGAAAIGYGALVYTGALTTVVSFVTRWTTGG